MVARPLDLCLVAPEVEDRALTGEPVGALLAAPREGVLEHFQHPLARRAGRIEGPALDEALEGALVHDLRVDAVAEVPDRRERACGRVAFSSRVDDRVPGRLADVLDPGSRPKRIFASTTAKSSAAARTARRRRGMAGSYAAPGDPGTVRASRPLGGRVSCR